MDFNKESIGQRLREKRKQYGLTQSEMAKRADITRVALGNYERGIRIPTIDVFARIAGALDMSIDDLLGYRSTPRNEVQIAKAALKNAGYEVQTSKLKGVHYEIRDRDRVYFIQSNKELLEIYRQVQQDKTVIDGLRHLQYVSFQKVLLDHQQVQSLSEEQINNRFERLVDIAQKEQEENDGKMGTFGKTLFNLVSKLMESEKALQESKISHDNSHTRMLSAIDDYINENKLPTTKKSASNTDTDK